MIFTKLVKADLDSPRQELSNGGLGIAVALLVHSGMDFCVCVHWGPMRRRRVDAMVWRTILLISCIIKRIICSKLLTMTPGYPLTPNGCRQVTRGRVARDQDLPVSTRPGPGCN